MPGQRQRVAPQHVFQGLCLLPCSEDPRLSSTPMGSPKRFHVLCRSLIGRLPKKNWYACACVFVIVPRVRQRSVRARGTALFAATHKRGVRGAKEVRMLLPVSVWCNPYPIIIHRGKALFKLLRVYACKVRSKLKCVTDALGVCVHVRPEFSSSTVCKRGWRHLL